MYLEATSMTPIESAFDELLVQSVALENAWTDETERAGLVFTCADIRHHVCMATSVLHGKSSFDALDGEAKAYAHEAFLSVLALGQLLQRDVAPADAIVCARVAVDRLLDVLTPYVSPADNGLRRVLLDGITIEQACAEVARGQ
jgi:hypothetical protein